MICSLIIESCFCAGHGQRDDDHHLHLLPPDRDGQHRLQPRHVRLPQRAPATRRPPGRNRKRQPLPPGKKKKRILLHKICNVARFKTTHYDSSDNCVFSQVASNILAKGLGMSIRRSAGVDTADSRLTNARATFRVGKWRRSYKL